MKSVSHSKTMQLPKYIRTKAEALALVNDLFPPHRQALATVPEEAQYQFYYVERQARDNLRAVLEWLFDKDTRVYKRPRWHLFYNLVDRLFRLMDDNNSAQRRYWSLELGRKEYERRQAAITMTGHGEGI
jgi:hypothetical protein